MQMRTPRPGSSPAPAARRDGFALLITVTLLAFLVLLLVSLASLTRVETQVASNSQHIAQARQNALMALNLALGQLQKHAGPDQRVTARADLQPLATVANPSPYPTADPVSNVDLEGTGPTSASTALNSIDTFWRAQRNRQWTGVWRNTNDDPDDYDPNNPAEFNPVASLQSWLVSGNENGATTFSPSTAVTGLSIASTPADRIPDANGQHHRLLVKAAAGVTTASDLDRVVTAPEREIRSTATPGGGNSDTVIGHYAWWIGDEGIKARVNLADPHAVVPSGETADERRIRETRRRQFAQRVAIEAMSTGSDGLAPLAPPTSQSALTSYQADLINIHSPSQFTYLNSDESLPDELKKRYHDFSVSSRGVLADVKNGGLKADLTYILGQPNINRLRSALDATYTQSVTPSTSSNRVFTPTSTLYANFPPNETANRPYDESDPSRPGIFAYGSTWEQLWSFHNIGSPAAASPPGAYNSDGSANPRVQTETEHGIYPLLIQCKLFFRLRFEGGVIFVDTIPLALIANPHAVPLAPADYQLRISGTRPQLVFGSTDDPSTPSTDFFLASSWPDVSYSEPSSYHGQVVFVLRTTGMKPGEAQIFTIDPDPTVNPAIDSEDRILVTGSNDNKWVYMTNEYDPLPALTYNTRQSIPANPYSTQPDAPPQQRTPPTRAALRSGAPQINTRLYHGYVAADGDRRLLQFVRGQQYTADLGLSSSEQRFLVVDPVPAGGSRNGGGYIVVLNQPPTSASLSGLIPQQAPFYQVNYRGRFVFFGGSDTTGLQHTLEWARTFAKNGSTALAGDPVNLWFGANLLRPSGSTKVARWGIVNLGEGNQQTIPPASIGGASASDVGFINHLYDLPRPDQSPASLGQLQHFNPAGFMPATNFDSGNHRAPGVVNSWQVSYPISNSYPHPRVPREGVFGYKAEHGYHFDGSYLWNDLLWDRFYFSTFPQAAGSTFDFATQHLANARLRPFRDRSLVPWDDETAFRGNTNDSTNPRKAAENLLLDGTFNINSTSVEAWKAVFSSLKNVPHGNQASPSAPFSRTVAPDENRGSVDAQTGVSPNSWSGFRDLSPSDIQNLAEEMVMQVRKRGPFLSLSQFINRRLVGGRTSNAASAPDSLKLGLSGALQAAIDRVTNRQSDITPPFNVTAKSFVSFTTNNSSHNATRDPDYRMSSGLAGFPGYILQGDVLSAIGASLSARSDTFTIRTYGDSVNPATGDVIGRAWCEAVVQRLPDYVDSTPAVNTPPAGSHAESFGRRFLIVSFRWLSPEDI